MDLRSGDPEQAVHYRRQSFYVLSMAAPLIWGKLLTVFDVYPFFGTMQIVGASSVLLLRSMVSPLMHLSCSVPHDEGICHLFLPSHPVGSWLCPSLDWPGLERQDGQRQHGGRLEISDRESFGLA